MASTHNFQCSKCGKQQHNTSSSPTSLPSGGNCPNGGSHVWVRVGRFLKQFFNF